MNALPTRCPVCSGELVVTRLHCPSCETTLEGSFMPGGSRLQEAFSSDQLRSLLPFASLTQDQLSLVLTFIRCEGRFNRMEEELGLSYPTLRGRLDEAILAMGFEPAREEAGPTVIFPDAAERQSILDRLNRGELNVETARRLLRGEQPQPVVEQAPPPGEQVPPADQQVPPAGE